MNIDSNDKRGVFPSDDHEIADTLDNCALSNGFTIEKDENSQKSDQIIDQFRENVANNMRLLRASKNMTQGELGKRIGFSHGQVAFLERKKQSISLRTLTHISLVFNVDPMSLLRPAATTSMPLEEAESVPAISESLWLDATPVELPQTRVSEIAADVPTEDVFSASKSILPTPPQKPNEPLMPVGNTLGSPNDPLDLATVARMIGAAHKRVESLKHKHGSVLITRSMLISVLAAILNASHDTDNECAGE